MYFITPIHALAVGKTLCYTHMMSYTSRLYVHYIERKEEFELIIITYYYNYYTCRIIITVGT